MPYLLTCTVIVQYRQTNLKQLVFVWQQKTSIFENVFNVFSSNFMWSKEKYMEKSYYESRTCNSVRFFVCYVLKESNEIYSYACRKQIYKKFTRDCVVDLIAIIHRNFIAININLVILFCNRHKDFFLNFVHNLPALFGNTYACFLIVKVHIKYL